MKISKTQIETLLIMAEGYEAGYSHIFTQKAWLQKGKVGHGGEAKKLTLGTFNSLRRNKLIEEARVSGTQYAFKISSAGKLLLRQLSAMG